MRFKFILVVLLGVFLSSCVGVSSKGIFGTGVSVALDPRTVGTQMDDSIMQKNLFFMDFYLKKNRLLRKSLIKYQNLMIHVFFLYLQKK